MYRVYLERAAEKDLKQLPSKLHARVVAAIKALAKDPRPAGCRKLTGSDNDWRIALDADNTDRLLLRSKSERYKTWLKLNHIYSRCSANHKYYVGKHRQTLS